MEVVFKFFSFPIPTQVKHIQHILQKAIFLIQSGHSSIESAKV